MPYRNCDKCRQCEYMIIDKDSNMLCKINNNAYCIECCNNKICKQKKFA